MIRVKLDTYTGPLSGKFVVGGCVAQTAAEALRQACEEAGDEGAMDLEVVIVTRQAIAAMSASCREVLWWVAGELGVRLVNAGGAA